MTLLHHWILLFLLLQVLSSGSWPFQQSCVFSLPTELERCVHRFTAFYGGQHSGRKLNWLYHMSKGELVTNCFKNRWVNLWDSSVSYCVQSYQISECEFNLAMSSVPSTKTLPSRELRGLLGYWSPCCFAPKGCTSKAWASIAAFFIDYNAYVQRLFWFWIDSLRNSFESNLPINTDNFLLWNRHGRILVAPTMLRWTRSPSVTFFVHLKLRWFLWFRNWNPAALIWA